MTIQRGEQVYISSKDNPRIKHYVKLAADKKYRRETGLFVIEGMRGCIDAVREYLGGRLEIEAVFCVPEMVEKYSSLGAGEVFSQVEESMRFEVSREVSQKMSTEGSSQGAFVIAKRLDKEFCGGEIKSGGRYLVLNGLQDPGNLGTMLRTADAVGIDGVVLTNNCVELYNPKVVRSAVGSMPRIDIFVENRLDTVCGAFREKGIRTCAAVVRGGTDIKKYKFSDGCAVVIGNEGRGLTEEEASLCDDRVTIIMHGHIDSLNAATAGTIFLWEMSN